MYGERAGADQAGLRERDEPGRAGEHGEAEERAGDHEREAEAEHPRLRQQHGEREEQPTSSGHQQLGPARTVPVHGAEMPSSRSVPRAGEHERAEQEEERDARAAGR